MRKSTSAGRKDAVYFVEGRQRIGPGVTINCRQGVRIEGRGTDAVLEVAGTLIAEGLPGQWISISDLAIELVRPFSVVRLEYVEFRGGSVRAPEKTAPGGKLFITNTRMYAPLDLCFSRGEVNFNCSEFRGAVKLRAVPPPGKDKSSLQVNVIGCQPQTVTRADDVRYGGIFAGVELTGVPKALVRGCWIDGPGIAFSDCSDLTFDGNTVLQGRAAFRQSVAKTFRKTRIRNCDFHAAGIEFYAPAEGKPQRVTLERCFFGGTTDKTEILDRTVRDCRRDPSVGVKVTFRKINSRPLEIGGGVRR